MLVGGKVGACIVQSLPGGHERAKNTVLSISIVIQYGSLLAQRELCITFKVEAASQLRLRTDRT